MATVLSPISLAAHGVFTGVDYEARRLLDTDPQKDPRYVVELLSVLIALQVTWYDATEYRSVEIVYDPQEFPRDLARLGHRNDSYCCYCFSGRRVWCWSI